MSRNGKIARMPEFIRTVIGQSLENNSPAEAILKWLNNEPEARKVLDLWFDGEPVTKQNLSQWRLGGFREWRRQQAACDLIRGFVDKSDALDTAVCPKERGRLSERLSLVMMAELIEVAEAMMKEARTTQQRWERLQEVLPLLNRVRAMDMRAERLLMWESNMEAKSALTASRLRGEKAVAPVLNLMAEEAVHRAMAMGPNYNQRAKDILNTYFRPGEKPAVEKEEESSSRRRSPRPECGKEAAPRRRRRSKQLEEAREVAAPGKTDASGTLGAAMSTSPVQFAPGDEDASETATSPENGAENLQPNTTSEAVPSEHVPTSASADSQTGSNPVKPSQSENETTTPNEATAGKTEKSAAAPDHLAAILSAADLVQRGHAARRKQIHDSFNNPTPPESPQE